MKKYFKMPRIIPLIFLFLCACPNEYLSDAELLAKEKAACDKIGGLYTWREGRFGLIGKCQPRELEDDQSQTNICE